MNAYVLAIGFPVAVFLAACAAIVQHKYRDDDPSPFNWQGTVPAMPGMCSCGAPHAKLKPFPGDPAPLLAAPVIPPPEHSPDWQTRAMTPGYVTTALDGHDDADGWVESRWRKIDGQMLAEQLGDGAL